MRKPCVPSVWESQHHHPISESKQPLSCCSVQVQQTMECWEGRYLNSCDVNQPRDTVRCSAALLKKLAIAGAGRG